MGTEVLAASGLTNKTRHSCVRCFDRKVKCDRQDPCGACVKHNVECVLRSIKPPRKRRKRVSDTGSRDVLERRESTQLYPTPSSNQTQEVDHPSITSPDAISSLGTPVPLATHIEGDISRTQLVRGLDRSKFVDNILWTRVVEQFHDPEDALDDYSEEDYEAEASEDDFNFVIDETPRFNTISSHPSIDHILQLWRIFCQNVDPLTKVVHVPTLQPALRKAANDTSNIPRSLEALMFAIYSTAIVSLKDVECKATFGEPRKVLLSRHVSATKAALARAKFMGTTSIVVLQALVLHTISVRDIYDPRTLWTLSGVAVRLAEALGLHRDGTSLGIPPFEAEVRRRLWWQLRMNDYRTAELSGMAKFQGLDTGVSSTKIPANVNDEDLYMGMPSAPAESIKPTHMAFCVVRSKLGSFATALRARVHRITLNSYLKDSPPSGKDSMDMDYFVNELEETMEANYLRYCDPSQPLQLMAMLLARTAIDFGRFMVHHPRSWATRDHVPDSEREYIWNLSIKLLEQYDTIQTSRPLQRFAWHAAYFLQWHALIHVLETIRSKPTMPEAAMAWSLVDSICENHPDLVSNTKKTVNRAVGILCLNAFNAREAALVKQGQPVPSAPHYITIFRQRREAAKTRSLARNMEANASEATSDKKHQADHPAHRDTTKESDQNTTPSTTVPTLNKPQSHAQQTSDSPSHQPTSTHPINASETDPFSFLDTFDNNTFLHPSAEIDLMSAGTDFALGGSDDMLVGEGGQSVNWTQWDAWLSDSNMVHANFDMGLGGGSK